MRAGKRALRPAMRASRALLSGQPSAFSSASVPVIDLSPLQRDDPVALVDQVASACSTWGFFQVVNHGLDDNLRSAFDEQQRLFFNLPTDVKEGMRRSPNNAMGWYDNELTKRRRDWKQGFDITMPASRKWDLPDTHPDNQHLDGFNQFPPAELLPDFRPTIAAYFDAVTLLADQIAGVMAMGLGVSRDFFSKQLRHRHSSYLRLNWYPPCDEPGPPVPLGISPHRDAGFLTVLAQDPDCHSLQVRRPGSSEADADWITVHPEPSSFTINTGDMAQIWSNNRYQAPEHRVLSNPAQARYSAPLFYNPAFDTAVTPLPSLGAPEYDECLWGYFRAQRFAGDFADYGVEIQASDFASGSGSWHVHNQRRFFSEADFEKPFDLTGYRRLLSPTSDETQRSAGG